MAMMAVLREITETDLSMVLEWRNAEGVRNNMYTNHVISEDEHQRWWKEREGNPETRLLICEKNGSVVGVKAFTNYTASGGTDSWGIYYGDRKKGEWLSDGSCCSLVSTFVSRIRRLECEAIDLKVRH